MYQSGVPHIVQDSASPRGLVQPGVYEIRYGLIVHEQLTKAMVKQEPEVLGVGPWACLQQWVTIPTMEPDPLRVVGV